METQINTTRNADTAAIAIGYSQMAEKSTLQSTVAWAVYIMDRTLGWNGTPIKGGRKGAVKFARNRFAVYHDDSGNVILDDSGAPKKRKGIYQRLAVADMLVAHLVAHDKGAITEVHEYASDPQTTPKERDTAVAAWIEDMTESFAARTGRTSESALREYLADYGKADTPTETVEDPNEALATDEAENSRTETEKSDRSLEGVDIDTLIATLAANAESVTPDQWKRIVDLARGALDATETTIARAA